MNPKKSTTLLFALPAVFSFGWSQAQTASASKEPGINIQYMDKTIKPSDDFFRYVNGTWLNTTEIPSDKTRWGSFDELRQRTDTDALAILKEAANNPAYKSNTSAKMLSIVPVAICSLIKFSK